MHDRELKVARLYLDAPLTGDRVELGEKEAHYLNRVLRLKPGQEIVVFNGRGGERSARVQSLGRRRPMLSLGAPREPLAEPSADITLVQSLIKSDAMDLIVQKITELGAKRLIAVRSDFSVIKLDPARAERRLAHWRRIAFSACEQSGRHYAPSLEIAERLEAALELLPAGAERIAFDVGSERRLTDLEPETSSVCLAVGPEGGFSPVEIEQLARAGFELVGLGARILRAETAAITACSSIELLWGNAIDERDASALS